MFKLYIESIVIIELPCATVFDLSGTDSWSVSLHPSSWPVLLKLELDGIPFVSQRIFTCCDLAVNLLDPKGSVSDCLDIADAK